MAVARGSVCFCAIAPVESPARTSRAVLPLKVNFALGRRRSSDTEHTAAFFVTFLQVKRDSQVVGQPQGHRGEGLL